VSHAGQRVVLGAEDDVQRSGAGRCVQGGRKTRNAGFDAESAGRQQIGAPAGRPLLGEGKLQMAVDTVAKWVTP
jgi:hypothetical protein